MSKWIYVLFIVVLLTSCKKSSNVFYFDIKSQRFCSCDTSPLRNLRISNDSIKKDGFLFEGAWLLSWDGNAGDSIASELNLQNLPNNYRLVKGGLPVYRKICKLKPNCSYLAEKFGGGCPSFQIRIWTDAKGAVYKTTHTECNLKSLE